MGFSYVYIISVALASHISTRYETGTAFIQNDRAMFYQDTIRTTINLEIPSPRLMLKYDEYGNCDASYSVNGIPLCQYQFNEFDNSIFGFLDLGFIKIRKAELMEKLNTTLRQEFNKIQEDTLNDIRNEINNENKNGP